MISTKYPHVDYDAAGVAIIAETNTRVAEIVLDHLAYHWDAKRLHEHHRHLHLGQIHCALAYYYDHEEDRKREMERGEVAVKEPKTKPTHQEILHKLKCLGLLP